RGAHVDADPLRGRGHWPRRPTQSMDFCPTESLGGDRPSRGGRWLPAAVRIPGAAFSPARGRPRRTAGLPPFSPGGPLVLPGPSSRPRYPRAACAPRLRPRLRGNPEPASRPGRAVDGAKYGLQRGRYSRTAWADRALVIVAIGKAPLTWRSIHPLRAAM